MSSARFFAVASCVVTLTLAACDSNSKQVAPAPPQPIVVSGKPAYLTPRADGSYVDVRGNVLTPPSVMLGVTMEQPGPALTKHAGIKAARSTLLVDVIPGLPADKARLEDHDIVISVDGSEDASPHSIRNRLKTMKPGDTISLTVRRGPASKTVTLTTVAWKAEHMVRPIHTGTFSKPGLAQDAEVTTAPRELTPIVDRLDRIEAQLQQLNKQVPQSQPAVAPAPALPR